MAKPKYRLENDRNPTMHHAVHGELKAEFSKGEVTPKNEGEEILLEHLVDIGLASRVKAEAKP